MQIATVEVLEWIINFTPHIIVVVITYPCLAPGVQFGFEYVMQCVDWITDFDVCLKIVYSICIEVTSTNVAVGAIAVRNRKKGVVNIRSIQHNSGEFSTNLQINNIFSNSHIFIPYRPVRIYSSEWTRYVYLLELYFSNDFAFNLYQFNISIILISVLL